MSKVREYLVTFTYTQGGASVVRAKSKEEAEELVGYELSTNGVKYLDADPQLVEFDICDVDRLAE